MVISFNYNEKLFFLKEKKRLDDIQAQVGEKIYSSIYSAGKLWSCFFLIRESLLHLVSISNWYHLIIVFNMFIVLLNISQFFQQNQVKPTNSHC